MSSSRRAMRAVIGYAACRRHVLPARRAGKGGLSLAAGIRRPGRRLYTTSKPFDPRPKDIYDGG